MAQISDQGCDQADRVNIERLPATATEKGRFHVKTASLQHLRHTWGKVCGLRKIADLATIGEVGHARGHNAVATG